MPALQLCEYGVRKLGSTRKGRMGEQDWLPGWPAGAQLFTVGEDVNWEKGVRLESAQEERRDGFGVPLIKLCAKASIPGQTCVSSIWKGGSPRSKLTSWPKTRSW